MGFVTPQEIVAKAAKAYDRFLKQWIHGSGDSFFPYRLGRRFQIDPKDPKGTIHASESLLTRSKAERGWGYTVHREHVRTRGFGKNPVPTSLTIDTLDDLLRLAKKKEEFEATRRVVNEVRRSLPQLNDWLIRNVRSLHRYAESIEGLIAVTQYFLKHPRPDCYARQIPVAVDTKFIERHESTLRKWLDDLLPPWAVEVNETKFERRFGLREKHFHRAIRLLDPRLQKELGLPFDELSLPIKAISKLPVTNCTVVIAENDVNVLTLPSIPRGIGIQGLGNSVNRLEQIHWLNDNRVLYWGDIDVAGFLILSRLRNLFPHVESIMMDSATLLQHERPKTKDTGAAPVMPTNLSQEEALTFAYCSEKTCWSEQEKIPQAFIDRVFAGLVNT